MSVKTVFEPFKIKSVEPLPVLDSLARCRHLKEASYNLFSIPSRFVTFDLLTDSGTSAMSSRQWSAMMVGDESYAGSDSYFRFQNTVQDLTGIEFVIPTHQGRSAEMLLMKSLLKPGQMVLGNTMFDTTRANISSNGGVVVDLPCEESKQLQNEFAFKGNTDLLALREILRQSAAKVAMFVMTITNNSKGGQPVSMQNIRDTRRILQEYKIPFYLDAARFAENAYFIKLREPEFHNHTPKSIAQEMFRLADGVLMSAKKDAFANIGGFLAVRDLALAEDIRRSMVVTEGFPTYGGLSGRDLEAIATGLEEILQEDYLRYRLRSVEYFARGLEASGFKIVKPSGGHAVYLDASASLPDFPKSMYPGQSLAVALYEKAGIRGCEIGSVMFGDGWPQELVRLAMPRRVYTQSHVDYMIEMAAELVPHLKDLPGYRINYQPQYLRHFSAKFEPINRSHK